LSWGHLVAGGKLKETGTTHWNSPNTGATNETGFSGLPGGMRNYHNQCTFFDIGNYGPCWTKSEQNDIGAWSIHLHYDRKMADFLGTFKGVGHSVRCMKDNDFDQRTQSDESDSLWSIIYPEIESQNIDMGKVLVGSTIEGGDGLWHTPNTGATNESGFSGLPAGVRNLNEFFNNKGYWTNWWSSTEYNSATAWYRHLYYNHPYSYRHINYKDYGFSVRCVKDTEEAEEVTICDQTWKTKNLNTEYYRNGDPIRHAEIAQEWDDANNKREGAWCYYDNYSSNGELYGKLYNWYAVNDPRGLAPDGWVIPTRDDVEVLYDCLGGHLVAGVPTSL